MNRMEKIFGEMKARGEKVNVLYFPIGDPVLGDSVEYAKKYFANGCTVLEIGLPYEDPYMDGKTVADSMDRAIGDGIDIVKAFDIKMSGKEHNYLGKSALSVDQSPEFSRRFVQSDDLV